MAQINLPKELLRKEAFRTLPAKEKEEYLGNLLKKILESNPEGITISQIKEATGLNYSTLWHHLEVLSCTAQCHKVSRGNLDVYFSIGKATHLNDYDLGKVRYSVSMVENDKGRFVCIYEKRETRTGTYGICKGVLIPTELIESIFKEIKVQ